ncbi:Sodium- and chloride-dependent GABA transporter 2, partial [Fragariocoptes setiger]
SDMMTFSMLCLAFLFVAILWMDACLYWHIQTMTPTNDDLVDKLTTNKDINNELKQNHVVTNTNYVHQLFSYAFKGLSIKLMMTDPIDNYLFAPLAQAFVELTQFNRYLFFISPNMISYTGVLAALIAAKLVSSNSSTLHMLSVIVFQIRTWLDALDGIVARSRLGIHKHLSLSATSGYVIDGTCDTIGFVAYMIGCYLYLRNHYNTIRYGVIAGTDVLCSDTNAENESKKFVVKPGTDEKYAYIPLCTNHYAQPYSNDTDDNETGRDIDDRLRLNMNQTHQYEQNQHRQLASQTMHVLIRGPRLFINYYAPDLKKRHTRTIILVIVCFLLQVAMVSAGWNRYILLYRSLLESVSASAQEAQLKGTILRSNIMWILIWCWRLNNGHAWMHMLTISVFLGKLWKFLTFVKYWGFFEIKSEAQENVGKSNEQTADKRKSAIVRRQVLLALRLIAFNRQRIFTTETRDEFKQQLGLTLKLYLPILNPNRRWGQVDSGRVGAKRTPIGAFGKSLKDVSSIQLATIPSQAAIEEAGLTPDLIDSVVVGNVNQISSKNGAYISRHVGLSVGVKIETPCLTVNRLCGSGFQSVVNGSQEICLDESDIVLCASAENMSQAPFVLRDSRFGVKFTQIPNIECSLWTTLQDEHIKTLMGITAENLAKQYSISRQEADEYALQSQTRWREAQDNGRFKEEMAPVTVKSRKGDIVVDVDEHPQATTMESLGALRPSFAKDGVCTAGNSSGIGDGGASILLASEDAINKHKLKPLARIVGYSIVGCDPSIMGIGPVQAIRRLLEANGLSLENDIDLVDINEAFAAQFLACAKELKLNMAKTNVNGGAIALAHPVGMSGGRIMANLGQATKAKALSETQFKNGHNIRYIDDAAEQQQSAAHDALLTQAPTAATPTTVELGGSIVVPGTITTTASGQRYREREQWRSKAEFVLSCIAFAVGLGNVWRFPYLCYKHGGAAFMVPYVVCAVTTAIPILVLEAGIGQYWQTGGLTVWRNVCPLSKGIGFGSVVALFLLNIYYIIILAWALLYMLFSFSSPLPWSTCGNWWNSPSCISTAKTNETYYLRTHNTGYNNYNTDITNNYGTSSMVANTSSSTSTMALGRRYDSTVEFWENRILQITPGIDKVGGLQWELAACLFVVWVGCFFCIWKGIKSTGKSAYIIALMPYFSLTILLIRGLTLPGCWKGLEFYLKPDFSKTLFNADALSAAATQLMWSYALALGCLTALGSYNPFNNNFYKQLVFVATLDSSTSVFAGFAIFSVLGFMAEQRGVSVSEVAEKGPGLAFIVYPQAITQMPWAPFWAVMFFVMILLLGFGSQFMSVEGFITAVVDMFPGYLRVGKRREWFIGFTCLISFLLGLTMVTRGGIYVFQLFDYYAASGMCLLFLCFCECFAVAWIYGVDRFMNNIKEMIGYKPALWFKLCWKYFAPTLCATILIMEIKDSQPIKYNDTYTYPGWAIAIGWAMALSSILMVPLYAAYAFLTTPGTVQERWTKLLRSPVAAPVKKPKGDASANISLTAAPNP